MFAVFDSSADHFRVVIARGKQVLLDLSYPTDSKEARRLFGSLSEVLAEHSISLSHLEWLACGRGPGGLIATRHAISVVHGLAVALDLPLFGLNSLYARILGEEGASPEHPVLAVAPARRGLVFAYLAGPGREREPLPLESFMAGDLDKGYLLSETAAAELSSGLADRYGGLTVIVTRQGLMETSFVDSRITYLHQPVIPTPGLMRAAWRACESEERERRHLRPVIEPIYLTSPVEG